MSAVGMTAQVLAKGLAEAALKDEGPEGEGQDISGGLFGEYTSAWLRMVAKELCDCQEELRCLKSSSAA